MPNSRKRKANRKRGRRLKATPVPRMRRGWSLRLARPPSRLRALPLAVRGPEDVASLVQPLLAGRQYSACHDPI